MSRTRWNVPLAALYIGCLVIVPACGGNALDSADAAGPAPDAAVDAGRPPADAGPPDAATMVDAGPAVINCGPRDAWRPTSVAGAPAGRYWQAAVWTGTEMMIWGGIANGVWLDTGGLYDPDTDTWRPVTTAGAPSGRLDVVTAWTGTEVLVWGGRSNGPGGYRDGARYDPATDSWTPMSTAGAPPAALEPQGVWTGSELIVWGDDTVEGGRYDPATDRWTPLTTAGSPSPRDRYVMVWGGGEVLVWGGRDCSGICSYVTTGGRYRLATETWTPTSTTGAPTGSAWGSGVWTGEELLVFGGRTCGMVTGCEVDDGGRYSPATDSWQPLSATDAPSPRHNHSGVWTGVHMLIWGGGGSMLNTGALYDPVFDVWTPMSQVDAPAGRRLHSGIWTDAGFIAWGGVTEADDTANTGGVYCPPQGTVTAD